MSQPNRNLEAAEPQPVDRRCLIVDDEPHLRRVLSRLMQAEGFECEEANNGREALESMRSRPVSLVLTDLHMPEVDGIELLRHINRDHPETAVMLVSAVADVRTAVECLGEGAMDYVTKPFHLDEVRARVRQALEKRRLIRENRDYQERLEERVAVQARRLEELFLASIQSLADALEVRDRYTHGHSLRVSRYSAIIARQLGMDESFVRQVELGGRVHDIGKIGIREEVLNKEGPLTKEEYQHIMTHPVAGWRILSPLLADHPHALAAVRNHHERWDGNGLPDGFEGESIPFGARIVSVADTFDAMTSQRPYRPGLPVDATIAELQRCSGKQFDTRVVEVFVRALEGGEINQSEVLPLG